MIKLFKLSFLVGVISFGVNAQTTVQIGTGTSAPGNTLYSPVYRYSATSATTTSQSNILFTAAEMTTAGIPNGAVITEVAFNKTTASNFITPATFSMLMGNTANTAPLPGTIATQWTTILTTHTQVYSTTSFNVPAVAGWATIPLTAPFVYTGGSLEIATDLVMGGNGAANGNFAWEYTPGFDTYIIGATSGNSNLATYKQRPNIQITFTTGGCDSTTAPVISNITPTSATGTWNAVAGSIGYEYDITTSPTPPAGGIATTDTTETASNLVAGMQFYFHVRNDCGSNVFSSWKTTPFMTPYPPCDPPSAPVISNITVDEATITWNAVPGSTGYEWVVSTSSTPPASGDSTSATTVNVTGLTGNTVHYAHVRNNCGPGGFSLWITTDFTTDPTGVLTVGSKAGISVYPNPVRDVLIVESAKVPVAGKILLLDMSGKLMKSLDVIREKNEIDMRDLTPGVYILKYKDAAQNASIKIVKE